MAKLFQVRRMRRSHYGLQSLVPPNPPTLFKMQRGRFLITKGRIFFPLRYFHLFSANISPFHFPHFIYNQFFINFILKSLPFLTHQITLPHLYLSKLRLKYKQFIYKSSIFHSSHPFFYLQSVTMKQKRPNL